MVDVGNDGNISNYGLFYPIWGQKTSPDKIDREGSETGAQEQAADDVGGPMFTQGNAGDEHDKKDQSKNKGEPGLGFG